MSPLGRLILPLLAHKFDHLSHECHIALREIAVLCT
jgi:hypothetical protein